MLEDTSAPTAKQFASSWWQRLAIITAGHSQRPQKKSRRWKRVLRKLIRTGG